MNFKVKKIKVSDITNPSHHATNIGGPISIKTPKIQMPKVPIMSESKTQAGLNRFRNLMRYLKRK